MEDASKGKCKDPGVSMTKSSLKRPRRPNNGSQIASCSVDGCTSDLSRCRDYHRLHKVCELHSKTSKVTIKGQERRFCQQCSRFHSLVEFDEGKRSCRRRLARHNKRRRKSQTEPMSTNLGTRFLPFGNPQDYPTNAVMNSAWGGAVKVENDATLVYRGKPFPFLQGIESMLSEASVCQPLADTNFARGNSGNSHKMIANGLYRDVESNRALSLLSLTPATWAEIGFSLTGQSSSICLAHHQSLTPRLDNDDLRMGGMRMQSPILLLMAAAMQFSTARAYF